MWQASVPFPVSGPTSPPHSLGVGLWGRERGMGLGQFLVN